MALLLNLVKKSGYVQVFLCMRFCLENVLPMLRPLVLQSDNSRSPLSLISSAERSHAGWYPSHVTTQFGIEVTHHQFDIKACISSITLGNWS